MGATAAMVGAGAASAVYGLGTGILNGYLNNKWAAQREAAARLDNYEYGEMAADNADERTRNLYADLYSPQAQMEQIKAAGLSPSLFYGDMGGISGQTGAQGTGAAGIAPTAFGMSPMDLASINKLNAEAELLKAKANTENGENERGEAEISNIIQNTSTALSQENMNNTAAALKEAETTLKNVETEFKKQTFWANVAEVEASAQNMNNLALKTWAEARQESKKADLAEDAYEDQKSLIHSQALKAAKEVFLTDAQTTLTKEQTAYFNAQIDKITNDIYVDNANLFLRKGELDQKKLEMEWNNYNQRMDRQVKRLELKLKRRQIEINHADRKAKMFISTVNTIISTFGAGALGGKKITERYAPNGASDGWEITEW